MNELFTVPEVLSPRLAWQRENGVRTWRCSEANPPWCAWLPSNDYRGIPADPECCGYGATEAEAVEGLAVLYNDHWNKPKEAQ